MTWPTAVSSSFRLGAAFVYAPFFLLSGCATTSQNDLNQAFSAAWGSAAPVDVASTFPGQGAAMLTARPWRLEPLGQNRFALLVRETRDEAESGHAIAGTLTVSYLQRGQQGWRVIKTWRDIAAAGETGGENMVLQMRRDLGPDPVILVNGSYMGQGFDEDWVQVVKLAQDGPVDLGPAPFEADDTGSGSANFKTWHYQGRVEPGVNGAVISVAYDGWTAPPSVDQPRTEFHQRAAFVMRDGCLVPTQSLTLPDKTWTGPKSADCHQFY